MTARPISRRAVLAGGAGVLLLAACGGSDGTQTTTEDPTTGDGAGNGSGLALVTFFDGNGSLVSGSPQRVTFGIGDSNGNLITDGPESLSMTITRQGGSAIGPADLPRHDAGLPRAYYPYTFTPQAAGVYEAQVELDGETLTAAFNVGRKDEVALLGPGDAMPVADTPTTEDARGVDPICTEDPPCPLHAVNLRDALTEGKPIALLISTPAYCQTAICGPILDVVLAERGAFEGVTFIHAEVYESAAAVEAGGGSAPLAPILASLGLTFEPAMFLIGTDGTIVRRLDVIFDGVELRQALPELLG